MWPNRGNAWLKRVRVWRNGNTPAETRRGVRLELKPCFGGRNVGHRWERNCFREREAVGAGLVRAQTLPALAALLRAEPPPYAIGFRVSDGQSPGQRRNSTRLSLVGGC